MFRSEVPSKQHNVQEGLTGGVQGQKISTIVGIMYKPHVNPCFFNKTKVKKYFVNDTQSNWVTQEMYFPLNVKVEYKRACPGQN